ISGSTLDAASFLDVFADDNRGGFTLNWGIDTSTAEIPVKYVTRDYDEFGNLLDTHYHHEMWSFNAINSVLNGQKYIIDGEESLAPSPEFTEILPTQFTFRIHEFNNSAYTNITYTIEEYGQNGEGYYVYNDLENIPATSDTITITGTQAYPYDYQIIIKYDLASGENEEPFMTSTWQYSQQLVRTVETTDTTATVTLDVRDNAAREFLAGSVQLFLAADDTEVTTATITINANVVTITGLTAETAYYITFNTNEGFTDENVLYYMYADVVTEATPA
ncbi:MAG: hypothetical protein AB7E09_05120, partial [Candidatus Izemoplasmatales bacterium]